MNEDIMPRKPGGTGRAARWVQSVDEILRNRRIIAGPGVRIDYTTEGAIVHAASEEGGEEGNQYGAVYS